MSGVTIRSKFNVRLLLPILFLSVFIVFWFVSPARAGCTKTCSANCGISPSYGCNFTNCYNSGMCCGKSMDCGPVSGDICCTPAYDATGIGCSVPVSCDADNCIVSCYASPYCSSGGGGGGCTCGCNCDGLATPEKPISVSPADDQQRVPATNAVLDWNPPSAWGEDQKVCKNNTNNCFCDPGDSGIPYNYDLYLATSYTPGDLPVAGSPGVACPSGDSRFKCGITQDYYVVTTPLQAGTRYYWAVRAVNPGPGGYPGGNGVSCITRGQWGLVRSFVVNNPPTVVSVSPNSGISGTYTDTDNGPSTVCGDHNPQTFRVTYHDADGCDDINAAYFWIDDESPVVTRLHSSIQGGVRVMSDGRWRMYGLGYQNLGRTCPDGSYSYNCYLNYDWGVDGGWIRSTHAICSPYYANSYTTYPYSTNTAFCAEGTGTTPGGWGLTDMFCDTTTNNRIVDWRVYFNKDTIETTPEIQDNGHLDFYTFVTDKQGGNSGGWSDRGNWKLDFTPPTATTRSAHAAGDNESSVRVYQSASDQTTYDSGLDSIINRGYAYTTPAGVRYPSATGWTEISPVSLSAALRWPTTGENVTGPYTIPGGSVVETRISSIDEACNMRTVQEQGTTVSCSIGCSMTADPASVSHVGGGTITLTVTDTGGVTPSGYSWSWVPGYSACGTLRTDPANMRRAYVDFLPTDVCTSRVQAKPTSAICTTNACVASFSITNQAPSFVALSPSSGISGTNTDTDNGPSTICQDYNPVIFTARYRDPDGCEDINDVYYWIDGQYPSVTQLHSSAHGRLYSPDPSLDSPVWRLYGIRYRSDICTDPANLSCYRWDLYGGTSPRNAGPCSPTTSTYHSDYMDSVICPELTGTTPVGWGAPSVTCSTLNSTDLLVQWRVYFKKDSIGNTLNFYGSVSDRSGASSGSWIDRGDWKLDFTLPSATTKSAHVIGDSALSVRVYQSASDQSTYDSGLDYILNRGYAYTTPEGDRIPSATGWTEILPVNLNAAPLWPTTGEDVTGPYPIPGGSVVETTISALDEACNMRTIQETETTVGQSWIQTYRGYVYGWSQYYDPIQVPGEHLSSYWLGGRGACSNTYFGVGAGSLRSWCSDNYSDANRKDWYADLLTLASGSEWVRSSPDGSIPNVEAVDLNDGKDLVAIYTGGSPLTLTDTISGRKILFVPNGIVNIVPDLVRKDYIEGGEVRDGLIIIGSSTTTINVQPGSAKGSGGGTDTGDDARTRFSLGEVDVVQAAVVTDGIFNVLPDDVGVTYDRLGIEGLAFYKTGRMQRNLLWGDATELPAVEVHHDPRYLYLFKDMLGRKLYTEFECGIVSNPGLCEDW